MQLIAALLLLIRTFLSPRLLYTQPTYAIALHCLQVHYTIAKISYIKKEFCCLPYNINHIKNTKPYIWNDILCSIPTIGIPEIHSHYELEDTKYLIRHIPNQNPITWQQVVCQVPISPESGPWTQRQAKYRRLPW